MADDWISREAVVRYLEANKELAAAMLLKCSNLEAWARPASPTTDRASVVDTVADVAFKTEPV